MFFRSADDSTYLNVFVVANDFSEVEERFKELQQEQKDGTFDFDANLEGTLIVRNITLLTANPNEDLLIC